MMNHQNSTDRANIVENPVNKPLRKGDPNLKLFIGGVPRTVADDEYFEYFSSFGELDDCILMRDQAGVCRGFGFVTYRNQEGYDKAMGAELQIRGRNLEQKKAVPQHAIKEKCQGVKVFLGGLSREVTKEKIDEYFSRFGQVVESVVMKDLMTGVSRGFGFVTFKDPASVDELMENPSFEFHGKNIQCKRAQSAAALNRMGRGRNGYRGGRQDGAGYRRGNYPRAAGPYERQPYRDNFSGGASTGGYARGSGGRGAGWPMDDIYAYNSGAGRFQPY